MDYDPWEELNIFIESFQPLKELDGFQVDFDSCAVFFDGNRVRVNGPEDWDIQAHTGDKTTTQMVLTVGLSPSTVCFRMRSPSTCTHMKEITMTKFMHLKEMAHAIQERFGGRP